MDSVSGVGVLDKAFVVLNALVARPLSLSESVEATGIPRATCHRLLAALADRLTERNVVVLLQSLGNAPDRWDHFLAGFWRPLQQRLGHAVSGKTQRRLHLFVVDNEPCPLPLQKLFCRSCD